MDIIHSTGFFQEYPDSICTAINKSKSSKTNKEIKESWTYK